MCPDTSGWGVHQTEGSSELDVERTGFGLLYGQSGTNTESPKGDAKYAVVFGYGGEQWKLGRILRIPELSKQAKLAYPALDISRTFHKTILQTLHAKGLSLYND
ncbi:hypothetical protein Vi05172_g12285 [Venturia inaequalis]|nr:hypothetical protein Vi05172_g12285 [Venturia inaequalis]